MPSYSEVLRLCLVTHNVDTTPREKYSLFLRQVIAGGVTSVQLRVKNKSVGEYLELAKYFKNVLDETNTPLIINDHPHIAKQVGAAGVHLGQSDLSPQNAREIIGPEQLIWWSVESFEQLEAANKLDCIDGVTASAVFASKNKQCKTIWGIEGLAEFVRCSRHPVTGIGGANFDNAAQFIAAGACGIAAIGVFHDALDPQFAAQKMRGAIDQALKLNQERVCFIK